MSQRFGVMLGLALSALATRADAATGTCDVSAGEYTAWTGTAAALETADPTTTPGVSEARCFKDIRSLGGFVVEDVFKDGKGRYANELPSFGKLVNMWPGENGNTICNGYFAKGQRNTPSVQCVTGWNKTFTQMSEYANALDWKYINNVRYSPAARLTCPTTWPPMGCFSGRCYDAECVNADGTAKACPVGQICKKGTCAAGDAATLPACSTVDPQAATIGDGDPKYYNPWDAPTFDLGGLANKVAIFAVNDHGPQPCESNEYTVYLTNNPSSRDVIDNPTKDGADPNKWNRARLFKIFTHGWIDNPDCCDSPKTCDPTTLPKPGDNPVLEADSMALVFSLPCGIAFRYASFIAGYDGKSLTDPSAPPDRCAFHSFDAEIDAVAGLNDDESAICPDKDGDGFPTCDCTPKPVPCDCVDDPAKDPDAKKYYPGAPQACDGPQYSCAPSPCPTGTFCHNKQCLKPCEIGEFKCPPGFTCTPVAGQQLCVPSPCGDAGVCNPGEECRDGKCVDLCAPPTKCPVGTICQGGKCLDPCALVKCPAGQKCLGGLCVDNCACLAKTAAAYPCKGATPTCDAIKGTCVPPGCDKTTCPMGKDCVATEAGPVCKGKCDDVVCPGKQVCDPTRGCVDKCELLASPCGPGLACKEGVCVDEECLLVDCSPPFVCQKGKCVDPGAGDVCLTCDTGSGGDDASTDAGVDASAGDTGPFADPDVKETSGCGCSAPGRSGASLTIVAAAAVAALLLRRRRR